ncbi:MAG: hypothetical protein IAI50_08630, partial [Candidatus Eremiobacteraeota bacterium]|nr:hypothetical protein [Candidatus Eremiobacteraeota bacterium]
RNSGKFSDHGAAFVGCGSEHEVFKQSMRFDIPGFKDRAMTFFRAYHKAKRRRVTVQPPIPGISLMKEA